MSAYRLPLPYERPPLRRRASGFALALGLNLALLLALLTLGQFSPEVKKASRAIVVDLLPESHSVEAPEAVESEEAEAKQAPARAEPVPVPEPPIKLPVKPTIAPPKPAPEKAPPWIEMSREEYAAADIANAPKTPGRSAGDSEVVGTGPHGETLYAAEWARKPSDAELAGYLPKNARDGFGVIACRTVAGNRVDDCIEIEQEPRGSHLASAVRQAAWQFRVRPPRKNGVPLVGSWVSIRIDYVFSSGSRSGM